MMIHTLQSNNHAAEFVNEGVGGGQAQLQYICPLPKKPTTNNKHKTKPELNITIVFFDLNTTSLAFFFAFDKINGII